MKFIKVNREILILLILLIMGENLNLFIDLKTEIGANVYYMVQQLGVITLIPSIVIFKYLKTKESKVVGLGIIIWNIKEFLDEIVNIFYGYTSVFDPISVNYICIYKILFINFIVIICLITFYYAKIWKFSSYLFCRLLPMSWQLNMLNIRIMILNYLKSLLKKISK